MVWSNHFASLGHGLIVTPLIVIMFSKEELSVWYMMQTVAGLALLADAGFGHILARAVAFFHAGAEKLPKDHKDYMQKLKHGNNINFDKLSSLLSTAKRIYLFISLIVTLITLPLSILVMWNVMSLSNHDTSLWVAYCISILGTFVRLQTIKWGAFMTGTNRVSELYRFKTFMSICRIVSYTIILTVWSSIMYLLIYAFVEHVVDNYYFRRKVKNWFKDNDIMFKGIWFFDKEIFASLWPATWRIGITTWGNFLTLHGISIIISQVNDARIIASYLFTQKILGFGKSISESPFYANLPSIYRYMARKDKIGAKKTISQYIFLVLSMLTVSYLIAGLLGNPVLEFFQVEIRFISGGMFLILATTIILESHASMNGTVYVTTNHVPFLLPSLISGGILIALGFAALPIYGLFGLIVIRFLVGLAINNWYSTYLTLGLLNWPLKQYLKDIWINSPTAWFKESCLSLKAIFKS